MDLFEHTDNQTTKAEHERNMLLQIRKENIKNSFCGLEMRGHRRQYVDTINGVTYYDDTKAECVDATWFTFDTITGPTVWIVDGKCNGGHYEELRNKFESNINSIICIGSENKIKKIFGSNTCSILKADNIEDAVNKAASLAKKDYLVIFSPSTRTFTNKNIGDTFRDEVMKMK